MSELKITSFKWISKMKEQEQIRPFTIDRDPIVINILLYTETQNQSIQQFEKWIRTEHKQNVSLMKLVSEKSLIPTIKTTLEKKHRKTFVVTTKSLTTQIQALLRANQSSQLVDLLKELKFISIVDKIEEIEPKNFWIKDICLISSEIQNIKTYIQSQIEKSGNLPSEQVSSLCSQDQTAFEQQFIKKCNTISLPKQSPKKQDKNQVQIVFDDTPGVGTYDVKAESKFKGSLSGTFSRQKKERQ